VTTPSCPARQRKPPTQLILSDEFKEQMQARMKSPEGQRALDEFARLIADWAFEQMPRELLEGLDSREGKKVLEELWPDIVNAYFKMLCNPPRKPAPK
jgi:hypothetical protein